MKTIRAWNMWTWQSHCLCKGHWQLSAVTSWLFDCILHSHTRLFMIWLHPLSFEHNLTSLASNCHSLVGKLMLCAETHCNESSYQHPPAIDVVTQVWEYSHTFPTYLALYSIYSIGITKSHSHATYLEGCDKGIACIEVLIAPLYLHQ